MNMHKRIRLTPLARKENLAALWDEKLDNRSVGAGIQGIEAHHL